MLKYFKEHLWQLEYADTLQTVILVLSVLFFVGLVFAILNKPKSHYEDTAHLPLEDDDPIFSNK